MSKYLIKGETINAVADKIRDCLDETVGLQIRQSAIGKQAGAVCQNLLHAKDSGIVEIDYGYNFHILIPPEIDGVAITKIGEYNGQGNNSVSYITISKSVNFISKHAFEGCPGLQRIYYTGTQEEWDRIDKEGMDYGKKVCFNSTLNRLYYTKNQYGEIDECSVAVWYREFVDSANNDVQYPVSSAERYIAYDYLANNEGVVVPVIYKTSQYGMYELHEEDPPDIHEPFFYVGTAEIDGTVYDKWRKIEILEVASSGIFYWNSEARQYIYTNPVVVDGRISPEAFPEKIDEVYAAGETAGQKAGYTEGEAAGLEEGYQNGYAQCAADMQDDLEAKYDEGIQDIVKLRGPLNLFPNNLTDEKLAQFPLTMTSKLVSASKMFEDCAKITAIPSFDISQAQTLQYAFDGCTSLKSVSALDTRKVMNFTYAFAGCSALETVSSLDLREALTASNTFTNCTKLENLTLKNIKVALNLASCTNLTVDSLVKILYQLRKVASSGTLTIGTTNIAKISSVYVRTIAITDEMKAEDDLIEDKLPFEVCDSTADGAMLITDYVSEKNWTLK